MWQQYGIHIIAVCVCVCVCVCVFFFSRIKQHCTAIVNWYKQLTIYCHLHRSGLNGDVITQMTVWIVPVPIGIIGFVPHMEIWQAEVWVVALWVW